MKYYSEKTNTVYEREEDCIAAEKTFDKKLEDKKEKELEFKKEKAAEAKKINELGNTVHELFSAAKEAQKDYYKQVKQFNEKYKEPLRSVRETDNIALAMLSEADNHLALIEQVLRPLFKI